MPELFDDITPDAAVLDATKSAKVIITGTDAGRDPAHLYERRAAARLAARLGAALILFDREGETWGETPADTGRAVGRERVAAEGRTYLLEQIDEAEALGVVDVRVWGHNMPLFEDFGSAVRATGADAVVVPEKLERPSLGDRWRIHGDFHARVKEQAGDRPVVVAHPDGRLTLA